MSLIIISFIFCCFSAFFCLVLSSFTFCCYQKEMNIRNANPSTASTELTSQNHQRVLASDEIQKQDGGNRTMSS
jgi:hypothetical protein